MLKTGFFLLFFLFLNTWTKLQGQTLLRGISNWKTEEIRAYRVSDFISESEIEIGRAKVDTNNVFEFNFVSTDIEKIILRGANYYSWLYIQPKTTYFIELPAPEEFIGSLERNKEIEMLFFRLNEQDINYKILGFEAWMDETIADIYQLKDVHPEEFIAKVRAFKNETAQFSEEENDPFFLNYVKYSVGITVDNFNIIGGPSKSDKFDFYLSEDSIQFKNPNYIAFAQLFYEKYFYQLDRDTKKKVESALRIASLNGLLDALTLDPAIQTRKRAEFVTLLTCKEAFYQGYLDRALIFELLSEIAQSSSVNEHRYIARNLMNDFKRMQIGMTAPDYQLSPSKHFFQYKGKWVYLHVFDPGNEQCITEIAALIKLHSKYGNTFQFVTIYPAKASFSKSEQRNLDALTWDKFPLSNDHEIWKNLEINSYPLYLLFDPNLTLVASPALSPTPNGRYETIEKFFIQTIRP